MVKVDIKLHNVEYAVTCDAGEENRLKEIVKFVDRKLNETAKHATNASETRLLMLVCLTLADELMEARRSSDKAGNADEELMVAAVQHLSQRVNNLAIRIGA